MEYAVIGRVSGSVHRLQRSPVHVEHVAVRHLNKFQVASNIGVGSVGARVFVERNGSLEMTFKSVVVSLELGSILTPSPSFSTTPSIPPTWSWCQCVRMMTLSLTPSSLRALCRLS
jgi:hypothetical protein